MMGLDVVIQKLREKQAELGIQLNPPATASIIAEFEAVFKQILPDDLRTFYNFSNGFETKDFMFRVMPIEDIINELTIHNQGFKGNEFAFAEYMVYSDTWKIRLLPGSANSYEIVNANHANETEVILTTSVFEFIIRYLDGGGLFGNGGLYDWFEQRQSLGY